ncbi:MAG: dephospho-CoA kinase [Dehalococcoidia bacterium]|nr:dephospho-CoA kinase [Dehalococcoidia bacterium]
MITIGLTGGIGSGKSLVARMLAEKGAALVNADEVGHRSYRKGTPVYERVVASFGREVLDENGEIDRAKLGQRVFADPRQRERLNAIVWPEMAKMMAQDLEALRSRGTAVAVLEAAVLIEAGWRPLADEVWVVLASPRVTRQRLMETKGMSAEQADARIRSQLSNEERRRRADVIIENNGSIEELKQRVEELWQELQRRIRAGSRKEVT